MSLRQRIVFELTSNDTLTPASFQPDQLSTFVTRFHYTEITVFLYYLSAVNQIESLKFVNVDKRSNQNPHQTQPIILTESARTADNLITKKSTNIVGKKERNNL